MYYIAYYIVFIFVQPAYVHVCHVRGIKTREIG